MAVIRRANVAESLSAFATWLTKYPVDGDPIYSGSSVRYQVARYCDYLAANPWPGGDPLREHDARDGAVGAYAAYLEMFNTPAATIGPILDEPRPLLCLSRSRRGRVSGTSRPSMNAAAPR